MDVLIVLNSNSRSKSEKFFDNTCGAMKLCGIPHQNVLLSYLLWVRKRRVTSRLNDRRKHKSCVRFHYLFRFVLVLIDVIEYQILSNTKYSQLSNNSKVVNRIASFSSFSNW